MKSGHIGGKVVSTTHLQSLAPRNEPVTNFCSMLNLPINLVEPEKFKSM